MNEVVRPSWLLPRLKLVRLGSTTHASGRAAMRVRGVPRQSADVADSAELPPDRVELLIDSELGMVLAMESFVAGRPMATLELRDLTVDSPESATSASFEPSAGVDIDDSFALTADFGSAQLYLRHDLGLAWALQGTPVGLATAAARLVGGYLARHEPTDGSGAVRFELRDISVRESDEPGDFDIAPDPGIPVLVTDGGPVHDLDLPAPVIAAADAASTTLGGLRSGLLRLAEEISKRRSGAT